MADLKNINIKELVKSIIKWTTPEAKDLTDEDLFDGNRMTLLCRSLYDKIYYGYVRLAREYANEDIVIDMQHMMEHCTDSFSPYHFNRDDTGTPGFDLQRFIQFELYYANGPFNGVLVIDNNLHNLLTMFENRNEFVEKVLLKH